MSLTSLVLLWALTGAGPDDAPDGLVDDGAPAAAEDRTPAAAPADPPADALDEDAATSADEAAPTPAVPDEWTFRVDTGVNWLATGAATGVGTNVLPVYELGFGFRRQVGVPGLVLGGITSVGFAQESAGNRTVRVGAAYLAADLRGFCGYELLDSQRFGLLPYAYAGTLVGGGPGATKVNADVAYRVAVLSGLMAGVGVELSLWQVVFALDLGAGVANFRVALQSRATVGVRF